MKILSWNVNGLGARVEVIKKLSQELCPDVMCFQKERAKGSGSLFDIPGYLGLFCTVERPQMLFGGVTTFFRKDREFDLGRLFRHIDGWPGETGNIQAFDFGEFILVNAYAPYSNATDEKWIMIRQHWNYDFHDVMCSLSKQKTLIVCGDLNIVSQGIDAWDGISEKSAGCFFDWEHRNFESMLNATGMKDSYRVLHPDSREYSCFFQNRPEYRTENQGFRIYYFLVSEELMPYVKKSEILTDVFDTTNSPILLEMDLPKSFLI